MNRIPFIIFLIFLFGNKQLFPQESNKLIKDINAIFNQYSYNSTENNQNIVTTYHLETTSDALMFVESTQSNNTQDKTYKIFYKDIQIKGLKTEPMDDLIIIKYDMDYGVSYFKYELISKTGITEGMEPYIPLYLSDIPKNVFNDLVEMINELFKVISENSYTNSSGSGYNNYYGEDDDYYSTNEEDNNGSYYSYNDYQDYNNKNYGNDEPNNTNNTLEYYNKKGKRVYDESQAYYVRYVKYDTDGVMLAVDYKDGKLYRTAQIASRDENDRNNDIVDGYCIWYYDDEKPHFLAFYENGKLVNNEYAEIDENGDITLIFKDQFEDNANGWPLINNKDIYADIKNGNLTIESKNNYLINRSIKYKINTDHDFRITTKIKPVYGDNNSGQGLIWGFKDWDNYNAFMISSDGYYQIYSYFDGVKFELSDGWKKSDKINTGNNWNKLQINKYGDEMFYSINSKIVDKTIFYPFKGNRLGFILGSRRKINVDYLSIRQNLGNVNNEEGVFGARKESKRNRENNDIKSTGSGIVLSRDGYIATNYHVAGDANALKVAFYKDNERVVYNADLVLGDIEHDLAIIKINDANFNGFDHLPYNFKVNESEIGEKVFALGYPFSYQLGAKIVYNEGTISSQTGIGGDVTHYQISVPVQPGNSGGPLFDMNGNLIGIVDSRTEEVNGRRAENIAYAIKTEYLQRLIYELPVYISLPSSNYLQNESVTKKVKVLTEFVPIIFVY
jgi:hypothetical protein